MEKIDELNALRRKGATQKEVWAWAQKSDKHHEAFCVMFQTSRIPWEKIYPKTHLPTSISYWRNHSRKIIRGVIESSKAKTLAQLKREISQNYPFGTREHYPYKIWLNEVGLQFGQKFRKRPTPQEKLEVVIPGQGKLF